MQRDGHPEIPRDEPPPPKDNPFDKEAQAAWKPAAVAKHDLTIEPKDFDKLDQQGAELLKKNDVQKITVVGKPDHDLLVIERASDLAIPLDAATGCRKITIASKLAGEFVQKPDGSMEIRNIRGLTAEVDPGKDPYLGISLPWVTANVTKVALNKGEDGKYSVQVTGKWGNMERTTGVALGEEQIARVKSVLENLDKLRTAHDTKPAQKVDETKLLEGVPEHQHGSWVNTALQIAGITLGAIAAAKAAEMATRRRTSGRNRGPADEIVRTEDRGKTESKGDATFVTDRAPTAEVRELLDKWKERGFEKDLERALAKMPDGEPKKELEKQLKTFNAMEEGTAKDSVRRAMAELMVESNKPGFRWDSNLGRAIKIGGAAGTVVAIGMLAEALLRYEPNASKPQTPKVTPSFGGR